MGRKFLPGRSELRIEVGLEHRKRLEHHAVRLRFPMATIALTGILEHLDRLDQQEAIVKQARRTAEGKRGPDGKQLQSATGIGPVKRLEHLFPEKIERSFRRFAEFMDQATSDANREQRAQVVVDEIKNRVDQPEVADKAIEAFKTFMKDRAASKSGNKLSIDETVVVAGDIEGT